MSGPELGLAIFGTVDVCLRYVQTYIICSPSLILFLVFFSHIRHVKFIVEKYHTLKNARTEIEERTLLVEATWLKTSQQLAFLRRVWESLSAGHQGVQERIINVLEKKLEAVVQQISKLEKHSNQNSSATLRALQAGKYALGGG
ncbi:unnamed protein product [Penicillium olsonii]|nr:unnamed protein product [Penicillium olsonii]CAG7930055.1 unnamed protein product [Penicillium olsonii]